MLKFSTATGSCMFSTMRSSYNIIVYHRLWKKSRGFVEKTTFICGKYFGQKNRKKQVFWNGKRKFQQLRKPLYQAASTHFPQLHRGKADRERIPIANRFPAYKKGFCQICRRVAGCGKQACVFQKWFSTDFAWEFCGICGSVLKFQDFQKKAWQILLCRL